MQMTLPSTTSKITLANRWDHFLARFRINRSGHRVEPGLYALGNPAADSPVFVTANYTLSFDALRLALRGTDGYILVLDTGGINVWCAAGKGTFGTGELVKRIAASSLGEVVHHRRLILPQLGAAGVAAHEVRKRSGFKAEYGPVRAADLKKFLETGKVTPEMRRVTFTLSDRVVLIPVELVGVMLPMLVLAVALYFLGGLWTSLAGISAILAGVVLFPVFLPWLPTRDFSTKGFVLGALVMAVLFLAQVSRGEANAVLWQQIGRGLSYVLIWSPVTAFVALNFTGSTTFTSKTGVRREMYRYLRLMAGILIAGVILSIALNLL